MKNARGSSVWTYSRPQKLEGFSNTRPLSRLAVGTARERLVLAPAAPSNWYWVVCRRARGCTNQPGASQRCVRGAMASARSPPTFTVPLAAATERWKRVKLVCTVKSQPSDPNRLWLIRL